MSEPTINRWWSTTPHDGKARVWLLALGITLAAIVGVLWWSPSVQAASQPLTALEAQLTKENYDLKVKVNDLTAANADLHQQMADITAANAKAAAERAAGAESGAAKAAADKEAAAAAEAAGEAKAAAERSAADQKNKASANGRLQRSIANHKAAASLAARQQSALSAELARSRSLADARDAAEQRAVENAERAGRAEVAAAAAAADLKGARGTITSLRDQLNPDARPVTAPSRAEVLAPTSRYFGMYTLQAPFDFSEYDQVADAIGADPSIVGYFQGWDQPFRADVVKSSWRRGLLPLLTWESRPIDAPNGVTNEPEYKLSTIINGDWDAYLTEYATQIADLKLPLVIRLDHEMNGDWYPWSEVAATGAKINGNERGEYVKMWQHVHDVFEAAGANEYVVWLWAPSRVDRLVSSMRGQQFLESYYPGDEYVDWIGMSGYHRPPATATDDASFKFTFGKTLGQLRQITDKPILLAEVGASEVGGRKDSWVRSMWNAFRDPVNDDVIGLVWFNHTVTSTVRGERVTNDWRITSSSASRKAFAEGFRDPRIGFITAKAAALTADASGTVSPEALPSATPGPTATGSPSSSPSSTATSGPTATSSPSATSSPTSTSSPSSDPTPSPTPSPTDDPMPSDPPPPTESPSTESSSPTPSPAQP